LSLGAATASFPLETLKYSPVQSADIDLDPQGTIQMDLSYTKFVDRWDICLDCDDDNGDGGGGGDDDDDKDRMSHLTSESLELM
jgi:hypothetical protein